MSQGCADCRCITAKSQRPIKTPTQIGIIASMRKDVQSGSGIIALRPFEAVVIKTPLTTTRDQISWALLEDPVRYFSNAIVV